MKIEKDFDLRKYLKEGKLYEKEPTRPVIKRYSKELIKLGFTPHFDDNGLMSSIDWPLNQSDKIYKKVNSILFLMGTNEPKKNYIESNELTEEGYPRTKVTIDPKYTSMQDKRLKDSLANYSIEQLKKTIKDIGPNNKSETMVKFLGWAKEELKKKEGKLYEDQTPSMVTKYAEKYGLSDEQRIELEAVVREDYEDSDINELTLQDIGEIAFASNILGPEQVDKSK